MLPELFKVSIKNSNINNLDLNNAEKLLDDDIKHELEKAELELENMWNDFEIKFGERRAARSQVEKNLRDPIVLKLTVRFFSCC